MQEDDNLSVDGHAPANGAAETENQSDAAAEGFELEDEAETETDEGADEGAEGEEEEAEGDDGEGDEDEGEGDEGEQPNKRKRPARSTRYQRRIARLEAENTELRGRNSGSLSDADVSSRVETIIGKPPNEADYKGDYVAFERAVNAYEVDKRLTTREVRGQAQKDAKANADRMSELVEDHNDRVEEFRTKTKDFDQVLKKASQLKASPTVEELVLESDKSAHLVYFLAKNPAQLEKLNGMNERQAAREVGRIESRLSLPPQKTATQAPKPAPRLKGSAAPSSPERDLDAYLKRTYGPRK